MAMWGCTRGTCTAVCLLRSSRYAQIGMPKSGCRPARSSVAEVDAVIALDPPPVARCCEMTEGQSTHGEVQLPNSDRLQMIQAVITRMAGNSSAMKSWMVTVRRGSPAWPLLSSGRRSPCWPFTHSSAGPAGFCTTWPWSGPTGSCTTRPAFSPPITGGCQRRNPGRWGCSAQR